MEGETHHGAIRGGGGRGEKGGRREGTHRDKSHLSRSLMNAPDKEAANFYNGMRETHHLFSYEMNANLKGDDFYHL